MNIALCFDKNLAIYAEVLMTSVCELHKQRNITFYIVHEGSLSKEQIDSLHSLDGKYKNAKVEVISFDIYKENLPKSGYVAAAFLRLFLPQVLPESVDKVIYFDCDEVICGDIGELFDMDMEDSYMALTIDDTEYSTIRFNELDIPYEDWKGISYFNTGMILMNLKKWREDNITGQILDFMTSHEDKYYHFADQDVINILYRDKIKMVHSKFNTGIIMYYDISKYNVRKMYYPMLEEAFEDPRVVHLYGMDHPWYSDAASPFVKIWRMFAEISGNRIVYKPSPNLRYRITVRLHNWGAKFHLCKPWEEVLEKHKSRIDELYKELRAQCGK